MPHPAWVLMCPGLRNALWAPAQLSFSKRRNRVQGSGVDVFVVQPGMSQTDFFPKMVG